jgi:hypothetical protein
MQARRILLTKTSAIINVTDIFAAFFLAAISFYYDKIESAVHANGCSSLLTLLSPNAEARPTSPFLTVFEPFIYHGVNLLCGRYESRIPVRRTTFAQMVQYINELQRTGAQPVIYQSLPLEAVHNYLSSLLTVSFCRFRYIAINELDHNIDREALVQSLMEYIEVTLEDPEFHSALARMESSFGILQNSDEQSYVKYDLAQLHTVEFLRAVLEATSIMAGLHSPKAMETAANILSSLRLQAPPPRIFYESKPRN